MDGLSLGVPVALRDSPGGVDFVMFSSLEPKHALAQRTTELA